MARTWARSWAVSPRHGRGHGLGVGQFHPDMGPDMGSEYVGQFHPDSGPEKALDDELTWMPMSGSEVRTFLCPEPESGSPSPSWAREVPTSGAHVRLAEPMSTSASAGHGRLICPCQGPCPVPMTGWNTLEKTSLFGPHLAPVQPFWTIFLYDRAKSRSRCAGYRSRGGGWS